MTVSNDLWKGSFNGQSGPALPSFPLASDVVTSAQVLVNESPTGVMGLADAKAKYALVAGSPAKSKGFANTVCPLDIIGVVRSSTAPSIGAFE
jgi:hypothetical protein